MEQEDILDKIPEAVLSRIPSQLKNPWVQAASVAVVSLLSGGVGGYFLGRRRMRKALEKGVVMTTTVTTETVEEVEIDADEAVLEPALQAIRDLHPSSQSKNLHIVPSPEVMITVPESLSADGDWDYEMELQSRHSNVPYVIHQEEFIEDEMGFRQETLTYYAGDDIMAGQDDKPVYNYHMLTGDLKFGHGSTSPDTVYIRNETIRMEWEILRHEGSFGVEVMGMEVEQQAERNELRHSNVPKFRRE